MDGGESDYLSGSAGALRGDLGGPWYLARLKPGGLDRARRNLERQGVRSFCPHRIRTERRNGRLVSGPRPLFPGYVFIEVGEGSPGWRSINATYGIASVVCLEPGRPARVPPKVMAALLAADGSSGGASEDFATGDKVRVAAGPFADFVARVEATPEKDRVFVLLDMMGRTVRTQLRPTDLERA